ncbi:hypothetical protein T439DRAFT_378753 [Meredithblackwellia eburnea MCA 4105]
MERTSARPAIKRQYGSRKSLASISNLKSNSNTLSSPKPSTTSQTMTSPAWEELMQSENDSDSHPSSSTSFPELELEDEGSSFSSTRSTARRSSPPTSPNPMFKHNSLVKNDPISFLAQPSNSSFSKRLQQPTQAASLLSFFKPASPGNKRRRLSSSPSTRPSDLGSDQENEISENSSKKKKPSIGKPKVKKSKTRPLTISNRPSTSSSSFSTRSKPKLEQLYLDPFETAGHSTLSCSTCQLSYARTPEDLALHAKHHKRVIGGCDWVSSDDAGKGVTVLEDNLDWKGGERGKIVAVDAVADGVLGRKIRDVLTTIDTQLCATSLTHSQLANCKLFIFLTPQRKVIACAVVQRIEKAFQVVPSIEPSENDAPSSSPSDPSFLRVGESSSAIFCSPTPLPTLLGVQRIWTSSTHRRAGLASRLLDVAAKKFIYGCSVDRAKGVAFSQPTGDGMELARRWTGTREFRVFVD